MLLLGLDTATSAVTVALHDGGQPLAQLVVVDAHRHAELLTPAIAKVIADAGAERGDLTGVAVGVGPGPYTGLRVGVVSARVLGFALGIPVYGVCSLDVIAADVEREGDFLVATDARRRELYWARYDQTGRLSGPHVGPPALIPSRELPVAGEGPLLYSELLPNGRGPAYPAAATLCRIVVAALAAGDADSAGAGSAGAVSAGGSGAGSARPSVLLPPEPLYLRRPDAREPGAPKRVSR
ncbi:tRNA (adenosine(37)-N6)-threonylcarbamoyltransferase complex dimerization subunit type 1 TsaB [Trebonia sp.]|uniref:tRNA (adenosine(37)-N6)-threonylcarbamoyltransferase complex dimerization subunit type 1 TsaB n=1 Tax=Trebonia sp. TaxID=2767075 RepID=UPI0026138620|nr:tRNA (adenosine(37)-N6)-threonylcarbamoyltransferase complex dimerization subunit type 1 TsaB [Trebonia sp.]